MIQITADTRRAVVTNKELLTTGSAGIQVEFTLSEDWAGLAKVAVFRQGDEGQKVDVVLDSSLTCVVPPEVLTLDGEVVFIGVYGHNGQGTVIIPTIWASAGIVKPGTEPATPASAEPTPAIWAQILDVAQDAEETATEAMSLVESGLQDLTELEASIEAAESSRVDADQSRVTAENQRVDAENSRVLAENARVTAESARASAETARATAEQNRASAETARASAESQRVTAENNRVSAEQNRVNAEDERVQAETDRATEFATWENTIASKVPNTRTVNGKALSTDITLDAGDIGYDSTGTYQAGSVGAELQEQNRHLSDVEENKIPELKNALNALDEVVNDPVTGFATKAPVIINTASGDIASFPDGADDMPIRSLVASIEPVQDLHGYDNPWPAGGGKNKLYTIWEPDERNGVTFTPHPDGSVTCNGTATAVIYYSFGGYHTLDYWGLQYNVEYILTGVNASDPDDVRVLLSVRGSGVEPVVSSRRTSQTFTITDTSATYVPMVVIASGVTCNNLTVYPMVRLSTETDATFAPYSNECPISGHTGMTVMRTGVNVWDEEWEVGAWDLDTGAKISGVRIINKNMVRVYPGQTVFLKLWSGATNDIRLFYYDKYKNYIGASGWFVEGAATIPDDCYYINFYTACSYGTTYNHDISINYPATDSEYHAYTGTTIPVTFPTTIYGGSDEVIGGNLVDNRFCFIATPDLTYFLASSTETDQTFYVRLLVNGLPEGVAGTCISNMFSQNIGSGSGRMVQTPTDIYFVLSKSIADSIETLKAWLTNNNVVFSYQMETPVEYTLTANELNTLYGQNNVWTDVGEVSVDYPADTKLYIDNKITTAIANALNS